MCIIYLQFIINYKNMELIFKVLLFFIFFAFAPVTMIFYCVTLLFNSPDVFDKYMLITIWIDVLRIWYYLIQSIAEQEGRYDPEFIKRVTINDIYNNRNK